LCCCSGVGYCQRELQQCLWIGDGLALALAVRLPFPKQADNAHCAEWLALLFEHTRMSICKKERKEGRKKEQRKKEWKRCSLSEATSTPAHRLLHSRSTLGIYTRTLTGTVEPLPLPAAASIVCESKFCWPNPCPQRRRSLRRDSRPRQRSTPKFIFTVVAAATTTGPAAGQSHVLIQCMQCNLCSHPHRTQRCTATLSTTTRTTQSTST